jgi:hypothetical protein
MITIDITSDIDRAIAEVGEFWRSQVPVATAWAINDTAFEVRNHVVNSTWGKAFKVRNRAFPGRLFKVTQRAYKRTPEAEVGQTLDRAYLALHADGGTKTGSRGGRIAIPVTPDKVRTATGRVKASMKPLRLEERKDVFTITKGARKFVVKKGRRGKANELLYVITASAKIDGTFRFYEDSLSVTLDVFPHRWSAAMDKAITSSRFYPSS